MSGRKKIILYAKAKTKITHWYNNDKLIRKTAIEVEFIPK